VAYVKMETPEDQEQRQPLTGEASDKFDDTSSKQQHYTTARHRPGYVRVPSISQADEYDPSSADRRHGSSRTPANNGLGIALVESPRKTATIVTEPVHRSAATVGYTGICETFGVSPVYRWHVWQHEVW
jgi:hypothetical protein